MEIKDKILKLVQKEENDLPTLPIVINQIIGVASNKESTVDELADAITNDPAMTTKLLKLANSMYYAQKTKVETIQRAISVIGFDEIVGIALGMKILSSFKDVTGQRLDMKALWIHSIAVAMAAKELAKKINPEIVNQMFIPALLHDMGKVVFSIYFQKEYVEVRQFAKEKEKQLYSAENAVFKLNHATLSALLMKRWHFPPSIMMPCRFHHHPESAPIEFKYHSYFIYIADYLAQKAHVGHSGNSSPMIQRAALNEMRVNRARLEIIMDQLRRKKEEITAFFEVMSET